MLQRPHIILLTLALLLVCTVTVQAKEVTTLEEVPDNVRTACEKYGEEYNIAPELLEAIIWHESRYTPGVYAGSCKGLMQVNVTYHQDRMKKLGVTDIFDVDGNIHVGADYLAELFTLYEDPAVVLGFYHGESNAIWKANNNKLSPYTKSVLKKAAEFEELEAKKKARG